MERHGLTFTVQPGTEDKAAEILSDYPRPATRIDDDTRLLSTTVFMKGNVVVRVFDVEGPLEKVMGHLGRQPEIRDVEQRLNPLLEESRDLTSPDGARQFFRRAMMERLTHRVAENLSRSGTPRYALLYPFLPGAGGQAGDLFQMGGDPPPQAGATRLLSTTVFRKEDLIVRVFEIDGDVAEAVEHLVRAAALFDLGRRLQPLLAGTVDLTNEEGLRRFFEDQMMTVLTHRHADEP